MKPSASGGFAGDAGRVSDGAGGRARGRRLLAVRPGACENADAASDERGDEQQRHDALETTCSCAAVMAS